MIIYHDRSYMTKNSLHKAMRTQMTRTISALNARAATVSSFLLRILY